MQSAPRSIRLQIAVAGRANAGKSSFLNLVSGQDVAITSPTPGTTTDVVEKPMELPPLGPVLWLDTAGIDDRSELGARRIGRSLRALDRADVILLILTAGLWGEPEETLLAAARERGTAVVPVVNKTDLAAPDAAFLAMLRSKTPFPPLAVSAAGGAAERERVLPLLKESLLAACPEDFLHAPPLIGDLIAPGGVAVMIVPIDSQAPKGRLILPQVQTIRDALDKIDEAIMRTIDENQFIKA